MVVKIIRKWYDKPKQYLFGVDKEGNLYCRHEETKVDLVLVDAYFKKKDQFYYKFINPVTNTVKLIRR